MIIQGIANIFSTWFLDIVISTCLLCITYYTNTDECLDNNSNCFHDCVNTEGSYHCECPPGYILQSNNRDCGG